MRKLVSGRPGATQAIWRQARALDRCTVLSPQIRSKHVFWARHSAGNWVWRMKKMHICSPHGAFSVERKTDVNKHTCTHTHTISNSGKCYEGKEQGAEKQDNGRSGSGHGGGPLAVRERLSQVVSWSQHWRMKRRPSQEDREHEPSGERNQMCEAVKKELGLFM